MIDTYVEQMIVKEPSNSDKTKKNLLMIGSILLSAVILWLSVNFIALMPVGVLLVIGLIYGANYLSSNFYVEYEYMITNGEMDIDKVVGKKKRSNLISMQVKDFEKFGKLSEAEPESDDTTLVVAYDGDDENAYYAEFSHETYGAVRLIFSPDENILENIKMYLSGKCRMTSGISLQKDSTTE